MSQIPKALFLGLLSVGLLNCKPVTNSSNLTIVMGPKPAAVLPVPIHSCKADPTEAEDIASPSFAFTTFNFTWNGANDMKISYIQIDFKNGTLASGKYQCIIAGEELAAVLNPKQAGITGGDTTTYKSTCGIRCGGMAFNSSIASAYLVGTAKVVGTEVDAEGNATPVVTETEVQLQYTRP